MQTRIVVFIAVCIIISITAAVGIGLFNFANLAKENAEVYMEQMVDSNISIINANLDQVEDAVMSLYGFASTELSNNPKLFDNSDLVNNHMEHMKDLALSIGEKTPGVISVYYRFNPLVYDKTDGFWLVRKSEAEQFTLQQLTDVEQFDSNDREHVAWFYEPMRAGKGTWLDPYYNDNMGIYIISYALPVYSNNRCLGIIGMDIDMSTIVDVIKNIRVYESGYAFMFDDEKNLIYHKDYPFGLEKSLLNEEIKDISDQYIANKNIKQQLSVKYRGITKEVAVGTLNNGMMMGITVPRSEIYSLLYKTIFNSVLFGCVLITAIIMVSVVFINSYIKPLKDLANASEKMATGDLQVELQYKTEDEIGILTRNMWHLAESLRNYFDYFNELAYTDELSKLPNKAAFDRDVTIVMDEMKRTGALFELVIMDINYLKTINDNIGHDMGDKLISGVASIIKSCYGSNNSYRIGGDEFAAILKGRDVGRGHQYINQLNELIKDYAYDNKEAFGCIISVASGSATYLVGQDKSFSDLFKRADSNMYKNKIRMKDSKGS